MMRDGKFWMLLLAISFSLITFCTHQEPEKPESDQPQELAICGWDSVFILRLDSPTDSVGQIVWSWTAADSPELPDSMKAKFATTDDCKPVDEGRKILITSSSNGVALVERATKKVLFWASVVNAHSADLLPDGLVAVASSHSSDAPGDRLILFAPGTPATELSHYELSWAHGVVWDDFRRRLYALGDDLVLIYKLTTRTGAGTRLEEEVRIALPERGGHEMYPAPSMEILHLSTANHCWLMNRDSHRISPHPSLRDKANVKSICVNPRTAQLTWTQAEGENWWTTRIQMIDPPNTIVMPQRRIYKVRWF